MAIITGADLQAALAGVLEADADLVALFGAGFSVQLDDTYGPSAGQPAQLCVFPATEDNADATTGATAGGTERRDTIMAVMVYAFDNARTQAGKAEHVRATGIVKSVLMRYRSYTDSELGQLWWGSKFVVPRTTTYYYKSPQRLSLTFLQLQSRLRWE